MMPAGKPGTTPILCSDSALPCDPDVKKAQRSKCTAARGVFDTLIVGKYSSRPEHPQQRHLLHTPFPCVTHAPSRSRAAHSPSPKRLLSRTSTKAHIAPCSPARGLHSTRWRTCRTSAPARGSSRATAWRAGKSPPSARKSRWPRPWHRRSACGQADGKNSSYWIWQLDEWLAGKGPLHQPLPLRMHAHVTCCPHSMEASIGGLQKQLRNMEVCHACWPLQPLT